MSELPEIRSLDDCIRTLFPYLSEGQRRELRMGIRRALMDVVGEIWGKRELDEDSLRENIRKAMEEKLKVMSSIPDAMKGDILDRMVRFLPAEDLISLKGKLLRGMVNVKELRRSLIESFEGILRRNFGWKEEEKVFVSIKDYENELKKIEEELKNVESKLGKVTGREEIQGGDVDAIKVKDVERDLDEAKRKLMFDCEEILTEFVRELVTSLNGGRERIRKRIESIREKIKRGGDEKIGGTGDSGTKGTHEEVASEIKGIEEKLDRIDRSIDEILSALSRALEDEVIREGIRELCEKIELTIEFSSEGIEGLERIIVDRMKRMMRKDIALYVSPFLGNPLREFYYRLRMGEEL